MPTLSDLVAYCDQRTRRAAFKDAPGACNGLQLANDGRVTKIGAAVDAGVVPDRKKRLRHTPAPHEPRRTT